jgi:predicted RNA-binding Zn-ribbon protein involved in translation (DUF1610 family)
MSKSFECPHCGAEVPAQAKACPECGSDENTGWSADRHYDGTGIEEPEAFDYDAWHRRETGQAPRRSRAGWLWWLVAVVLAALLLLAALSGR